MSINRLNLQQIRVLAGMLEEASPTKVAERLRITQPAVSAALRQMRQYFDDPLFVRSGNTLYRTPFASSLEGPLKVLLQQEARVARMRPETQLITYDRSVRMAISEFVSLILLASLLRRLPAEAPLITTELVSIFNSRHHYSEDLDRGTVDLIVLPEPFASPNHPREHILTENYVCVVWENSAFSKGFSTVEQFVNASHVAVSNRTVAGRLYDEMHLSLVGITLTMEVSVPNQLLIPEIIVGTNRVAILLDSLAQKLARHWPIKVVPCPVEIPPLVEVVQWQKHDDDDPAIMWFRKGLKEAAANRFSGITSLTQSGI